MKYTLYSLFILMIVVSSCKKKEPIDPIENDPNNNPPADTTGTNDSTNVYDVFPYIIEPGTRPIVIAHRGGRGLRPENTLVAFDYAVSIGVDVLEMDVVLTKDSVLVTIHDVTIDNTADTTGSVADYTYQQLQQFNFGYHFQASDGTYPYRTDPVRIPRLQDVLMAYPDALLNIEIKNSGAEGMYAASRLVDLINTYHNPKKVVAFSFDNTVMNYFRSINTDSIITGASLNDVTDFLQAYQSGTDSVFNIEGQVFALPTDFSSIDLTESNFIDAIHRHDVGVHYWTINDKAEMKTLIQKGADAIITDRPDLMQEALTELGF